jgi:MerR family transcriptional regulator/heat shock protein HspR
MVYENDQALFIISRIAKMLGIHPQTLRLYEREGFIKPARTQGNTRLYSQQDVEKLRVILHLTRECGVNLAGVQVILSMRHKLEQLQCDIDHLRQDLVTCLVEEQETRTPLRALVKATSRMLVKVR